VRLQTKTGLPSLHQRLIYAGKQLCDEKTLAECSVGPESTLHVVLRLRGGKGGFGALLRGAGMHHFSPECLSFCMSKPIDL
jgi:hypothetical protein